MDFSGINVNSAAFFVAGDADALDARTILLLLPVVTFVLAIVVARFAFTRPETGPLFHLLTSNFLVRSRFCTSQASSSLFEGP